MGKEEKFIPKASIIDAEGELQAADKLREAAAIISREPQAIQLRYLGALSNIAGENSSTIVFPLPIDFLHAISGRGGDRTE